MAIKILLDPGHFYGVNKMPNGYAEGTQMWKLYTYLRPMLESYGFVVGTTRTSTYDYPKSSNGSDNITGRGRMAKGYDIMLSLHTNACNTESVNRPVVIYPISGKAKDLADKIGSALQSCMNLQKYQIYSKTGSSGDYYGVIRGAASVGVPCLIIEHTFHTNNTMAKWLLSDVNLKKVAQCVADTVAKYYGYSKKEDEVDMTKEELIKLIDERIKVAVEGANTQPSSWAKNELEEAKAMGITDGSRPQGLAKRQEVAAMVLRAIKK